MTTKEKELFDDLKNELSNLKKALDSTTQHFANELSKQEDFLKRQQYAFEKSPIVIEQQFEQELHNAMLKSAKEVIANRSYDRFKDIADSVINRYAKDIEKMFSDYMETSILKDDFKEALKQIFAKKVAHALNQFDTSIIDRTAVKLKDNPEFRAKLTLVISNLVNEFLSK